MKIVKKLAVRVWSLSKALRIGSYEHVNEI
jgi:hypothetical protein